MLGDECNCMQRDKFTTEIFDPFQNVLQMNITSFFYVLIEYVCILITLAKITYSCDLATSLQPSFFRYLSIYSPIITIRSFMIYNSHKFFSPASQFMVHQTKVLTFELSQYIMILFHNIESTNNVSNLISRNKFSLII